MLYLTAERNIHALPSIESYFSGYFTHSNESPTGQAVGPDDEYVTKWKHSLDSVVNQNGNVYVETKAEPLMFYGDDEGKYRVHRTFELVEVDGQVKVSKAQRWIVAITPRLPSTYRRHGRGV